MDPLSLTAGIIALAQAAAGLGKGIQFLHSLREIPAQFVELLEDLATLQSVTDHIHNSLRELESTSASHSEPPFSGIGLSILASLEDDLAQIVKDLDALCDRLKKPGGESMGSQSRVSKYKWQREKEHIAKLRNKARTTREYLALCFSVFSSSQMHQQIKLLHDLKQSLFNSTQALLLNQKDYSFAHNESQKAHFQLHESVDQQDASLSEDGETGAEMTTVSRPKDGQLDDKDSSNPLSTADEYTAMSLNSSCHYSCRCKCHQLQNSQSPGSLAWLGTAFMQSRAVSLFSSPECDIVSCRSEASPSLRMVYIFPQWLLARSIEIAVSWSALTGAGSSLHLRVPRVLGKHPVWRAISLGDFDWIQRNLAKKTILPTDVGEHGQSLAWVALFNYQIQIASLFARHGCDMNAIDSFGSNAAMQARILISTEYTSSTMKAKMRANRLLLDEMSSSWIKPEPADTASPADHHSLGITKLLTTTTELTRLDRCGFSPLHWAVRMRNIETLKSLLAAGADPDIVSSWGYTALFSAVVRGLVEYAELLLNAGADVNSMDPYGKTPIIETFGFPEMVKLLLDHGAKVCVQSSDGPSTPLGRAADFYHDWESDDERTQGWAASLDLLISTGMDIDLPEGPEQQSPIMLALLNRNAPLVELLIDRGANLGVVDIDLNTVFHYAALSTQLECIEILRRADTSIIDPNMPNKDGKTPMAVLVARMYVSDDELGAGEHRVTNDEFWAFAQLIREIQATRSRIAKARQLADARLSSNRQVIELTTDYGDRASLTNTDNVDKLWEGSQASDQGSSDSDEIDEFFDAES